MVVFTADIKDAPYHNSDPELEMVYNYIIPALSTDNITLPVIDSLVIIAVVAVAASVVMALIFGKFRYGKSKN